MKSDKPIFVTQPTLPPLAEFLPYLERIWESRILTNGGPFHQELEAALCEYLEVEHISLFTNGTIALVTALQALQISGEVITTPYTFVATAHSLLWNNIEPVFVDIDPVSLNLDPSRIEAAITARTTAIMPVHCYGHPCDGARIQEIANANGLKVIYDAAHVFGAKPETGTHFDYGDLSVLSFHATKVFNTFEGGAIISRDARTKQHVDHLKNFGFVDETTVIAAGINGKMSELNAALGLLQLRGVDHAIDERKKLDLQYRAGLENVPGIRCLPVPARGRHNYAYFPILVDPDYPVTRDELFHELRSHGVYSRRYFYPLVSEFPMYRDLPSACAANLPVAHEVADRVICLPIYPHLPASDVAAIIALVANVTKPAANSG